MSTLAPGDGLLPPSSSEATSTVSNCGSTTPEAVKLASLQSALDLVNDDDDVEGSPPPGVEPGISDETPDISFTIGSSLPAEIRGRSPPDLKVEDFDKLEQRDRGDSSATGNSAMTDSQEWEKIESEDAEVKVAPEDVKEPEPEYEDILGSGQILKKVLVPGEANSRPTRGNRALVTVVGKLENGVLVEEFDCTELSVGDIEINQGVDLLLPLMNKGETAEAIVKPRFCYGSAGVPPKIPAEATITYRIELKDFYEEDMESVTKAERIRIGNQKKEKGNFWFGRQAYASAVQLYRRALDYLDENASDEDDGSGNGEKLMKTIWEDRLKVYNNLAIAQMKLEAYDAALRSVDCVLRCQPLNVKALFRKAKILTAKGQTEEALEVMKKAAELDPEDKAIAIELSKLLAKKKAEREQDSNLYKKMFKEVSSPNSNSKNKPGKSSSFFGTNWKMALSGCIVAGIAFAIYKLKHM